MSEIHNQVLKAFKIWGRAYNSYLANSSNKELSAELYINMGEAWEDYLNLSRVKHNIMVKK